MPKLQANSPYAYIKVRGDLRLFYSYETCVGVGLGSVGPIFTGDDFSQTTTRHIRKFKLEHGGVYLSGKTFRAIMAEVAPDVVVDRPERDRSDEARRVSIGL